MTRSRGIGPVGIVVLLLLLALLLVPPTKWPAGIPNAIWAPDPKEDVGPLYGIAGVDPNDVWAVGRTASAPHKALIAHWDGWQWSVAERLSVMPRNHVLMDIVVLSKDDVWAVGSYESGEIMPIDAPPPPTRTPLIVHWDGTHWEVVPVRIGGEGYGRLEAISATKDGHLWAVGSVLLHWDGSSWEEEPMPRGGNGYREVYYDIAAVTDDDVWVAGYAAIFHWDGAAWKQIPNTPGSPSSVAPMLEAIEVISDKDVWVAGQSVYIGGITRSLELLHWDGANLKRFTSPSAPGDSRMSDLTAVGCPAPERCSLLSFAAHSRNDIWLVGDAGLYPLVSHWDGERWQSDPCPTGEPPDKTGSMRGRGGAGALYDVGILAPDKIWAVGSRTFIEGNRFAGYGYVHSVLHGPCPTPEQTATRPPTPTFDTRPRPTLPPPPQTVYPTLPAGPGTMYPPVAAPDTPPGIPTTP